MLVVVFVKVIIYWEIGIFICFVVAPWAMAEEACSRCYGTLQNAHWAADFQHPSARHSLIPANSSKIAINYEFLPSGGL